MYSYFAQSGLISIAIPHLVVASTPLVLFLRMLKLLESFFSSWRHLFENADGTPMTSTQMETKIAWIAKKYDLVGAWSINSLRHLIATFINDADYSDKQKRAVATAMGTSINMLHKHYIDSKKETFNVDVLEDNPKKKWVKKNKK